MSSVSPESELDLEKLFLPAWAQESPSVNKYASHSGEDRQERGRGRDRDSRGPRRDRPPGQREGGPRFQSGGPRGPRPQGDRPRGPRPDRSGDQRGPRPDRRGGKPGERFERREPLPLPEIEISFLPDNTAVEVLGRQIRNTGRAYPLFEIAQLILQKPERQLVKFDTQKKDGKVVQPLFLCALDDTLWLSEQEAVNHVLQKHFDTFYKAERTAVEPPKGVYTFVAQCGMSGIILGPPNYHDYQNQLHKLHQERFARMPFDMFKSRVKIVKDEAVVKKWIEDKSFRTEFDCLNVPEPKRLTSREDVEKHFREVHMPNIIKQVESHTLAGPASRDVRGGLQRALRSAWEDQRRFPLKLATTLSQKLSAEGLQFFKVNKTVTHVSVARPHYLDLEATPVSEGVRKIVEFINATPKSTRRKLIEALAPSPKPAVPAAPAPAPAAEAVNGDQPAQPAQPAAQAAPTPEQSALIADLHWLVHQGHVIEFANGIVETAKKPVPKPPKPEKAPAPAPAEGATPEAEAAPQANAETNAAPVEVAADSIAVAATEPSAEPAAPAEQQPAAEATPEPSTAPSGS